MSGTPGNLEDEEVGLLGHHKEDIDTIKHYAEPISHIRNRKKGCKQLVCPCLEVPPDGCELTQSQCDAFGRMETKMKTLYDRTNAKHEAKLKALYEEFVFPTQPPAD